MSEHLSQAERARLAAQRRADLGTYQPKEGRQSSRPSSRKRKKPRRASRKKLWLTLLAIVGVIFLVFWGMFTYVFSGYDRAESFPEKNLALSENAPSHLTHVAIFGVDSYEGTSGRADCTLILSIDHKNDQIKLSSVLRDSYLPVKGYGNDKLTHAYAYGGAELMLNTLNQNFDLNITEYVILDYKNVADMVEYLGGVDLEITEAERKEINRICLEMVADAETLSESGLVHLNGLQATAYARIRKIDSETQRTARQRAVIGKLMENIRNRSVFEYPSVLRKLASIPKCSLSEWEVVGLGLDLLGCDGEIRQYVLPSEEDHPIGGSYGGFWCWRYDIDAATLRFHEFLKSDIPSATE